MWSFILSILNTGGLIKGYKSKTSGSEEKKIFFLSIKANAELQYVWNTSGQVQIGNLKIVERIDYINFP